MCKTIGEKEDGPGFDACLTLGLRMPSMHVTSPTLATLIPFGPQGPEYVTL